MLLPPNELPERAPRLAEGRYVLLARIGKGGMAGVYAAWDTQVDEWRAIKVLFPKHARDRSLRTRFENEARTMTSLNHPNLVRVYDVGRGERLPYMVMELINAGSLYRWTKTYGPMPPRMAVEAMMQLCNGLQAVHENGIVHRDIKPRNVLINWDGVLKLTDFGIAQLESSQETRTGLAMGTLGFMSPEQLHDAKSVDLRTDIYALGATLWAQLTARKARDLFRLEDKPSLMDGVPRPLQVVLSKCLAYERDDRFPSAASLGQELERVLAQLPEDPADAPPLPLNLGAPSLKSKPDNTFSEILTLSKEETTGAGQSAEAQQARERAVQEKKRRSLPPVQASSSGVEAAPKHSLPMSMSGAHSITDSRPAHMRLTVSDDEGLPSYMLGVEQPSDIRRAEVITYDPGEYDQQHAVPRRSRSRIWTVVGAVLLAPFALVLGGLVALAGAAGLGAYQLSSAKYEVEVAREEVSERVRVAEPLVSELEVLGAEIGALEQARRRWEQATDEVERAEAAVMFVELSERLGRPLLGFGERPHEEQIIRQRLDRLGEARAHYLKVKRDWEDAAGWTHSNLAIRLRLADDPWMGG